MRVADHLVSNSIRLASTFERYRISNVHRLYRRPFSFPKNPNPVAKGAVRFCIHLSARADLGQATPDSVRPLRSPASWRLTIQLQLYLGRFVSQEPFLLIFRPTFLEEFMLASYKKSLHAAFVVVFCLALGVHASAQSVGNSGSINGTVVDPTGAVVAKATVEIHNPVSGFDRSTTTDRSGKFEFTNVPFNPYHLVVTAEGFAATVQDVEPRSAVPVNVAIKLKVSGSTTQVTVEAEGGDLIENDPTFHTDVDKNLFDKLPLESQSSSLSNLVTLATPGISADSNGLFHGLGEHAEASFSVDGQPITDQQSKIFSNQIPLDSIQSMEVIAGAPPAEYGDKTSVVINVTTRSGQGVTTPHGSVTASYGSFGTSTAAADLSYGGQNWGNFVSVSGLNSGRFLDPPEFVVLHDKGNEENLFDRVDYQISSADSIHLNFGYTRSWFQTPNTFDSQNATPWNVSWS